LPKQNSQDIIIVLISGEKIRLEEEQQQEREIRRRSLQASPRTSKLIFVRNFVAGKQLEAGSSSSCYWGTRKANSRE